MKFVLRTLALAVVLVVAGGPASQAHEPDFTDTFHRGRCTFTTVGGTYFPLWPGHAVRLEGEEEDDGEIVDVSVLITVLADTLVVDGVATRVFEEREEVDGEVKEISRNYAALCRETGDVWYFGEDVDNYEDGQVVNHNGSWRAGQNGASAGILMLGNPMVGARYFTEMAPGIAMDRAEITAVDAAMDTPAGSFQDVLTVLDSDALDPGAEDPKAYAPGVGQIQDEDLQLVEIIRPACQASATTLCLNNGRFKVEADWARPTGETGDGKAILQAADAGEFWFFRADNTELIVKVLNACSTPGAPRYWVFASGLTNVAVTLTVTDTKNGTIKTYNNPQGQNFTPILDTGAFATCP